MSKLFTSVVLALTVSACSGSGPNSAPVASPCGVAVSPILTPPPMSSGLAFTLTGINTTASGTVTVHTPDPPPIGLGGSVFIYLAVSGLKPCSSHIAHVYKGTCEQRGVPLNQTLDQVVADRQGMAQVMTTLRQSYDLWIRAQTSAPGDGTWYVVVHAGPDMKGSNATDLLCGNLFS
jgi:hypothetical protein